MTSLRDLAVDPEDKQRLDALAVKLGNFVDGEKNADVTRVCAAMAAFGAASGEAPERILRMNFERLMKFMRDAFESALKHNEEHQLN